LITTIIRDAKVLGAKNKANAQLEKNLESAPRLVENYKNLGATNELIMDALPNTADFPGLTAMMENLTQESGLTLKSISPSSGALATGAGAGVGATSTAPAATTAQNTGKLLPQMTSFNVAFDGSYQAFQRLVANIEASARPVRINSVQLSGSGGSLAVQMEATTYYQDKATVPFRMETVK
jgi:Tfp pilus assembly protein PilO